eukprot:7366833-Alexandrium_andersonii.AAC.1
MPCASRHVDGLSLLAVSRFAKTTSGSTSMRPCDLAIAPNKGRAERQPRTLEGTTAATVEFRCGCVPAHAPNSSAITH